MNKKVLVTLLALGVYLVTAGVSYSIFAKTVTSDYSSGASVNTANTNDYGAVVFDPNQPKTEACPVSGAMYSKQQRDWWEKHRPLAVMIENHPDARPQSGLSFADTVYEAVAEGGITRFMAVFYCQDAGIVGPVRSARTYFLDFASEYGGYPLYAHVGGANTPGPADALGQIEQYGWAGENDLNQFSVGYPTYKRDEARAGRPVATEHTMYSTTSSLWAVGQKRDLTDVNSDGEKWDANFRPYSFKDDAPASARPAAQKIHVEYWSNQSDFYVDWTYNKATNTYLRNNGGEPHVDRNTGKQLSAKNIVALFMTENRANDGYEGNLHMLYGDKGSGKAIIFMDGKEQVGKWQKSNRTARTIITVNGSEVKFDRGTIWFHILPTDGVAEVQ